MRWFQWPGAEKARQGKARQGKGRAGVWGTVSESTEKGTTQQLCTLIWVYCENRRNESSTASSILPASRALRIMCNQGCCNASSAVGRRFGLGCNMAEINSLAVEDTRSHRLPVNEYLLLFTCTRTRAHTHTHALRQWQGQQRLSEQDMHTRPPTRHARSAALGGRFHP